MKKYEKKKAFILAHLKKTNEVNTLDRYFVDDYEEEFKVKVRINPYGANHCPDLAKTLRRMFDDKILKRWACGLDPGMSSMGFPKWIWSYQLR